jgi:hypothetical protein
MAFIGFSSIKSLAQLKQREDLAAYQTQKLLTRYLILRQQRRDTRVIEMLLHYQLHLFSGLSKEKANQQRARMFIWGILVSSHSALATYYLLYYFFP